MEGRFSVEEVKQRAQQYKVIVESGGVHTLFQTPDASDEIGNYLKLKIASQLKGRLEDSDYFKDEEVVAKVKGAVTAEMFLPLENYQQNSQLNKVFRNPQFQQALEHQIAVSALDFFEYYKRKFSEITGITTTNENKGILQKIKELVSKNSSPEKGQNFSLDKNGNYSTEEIIKGLDKLIAETQKSIFSIEKPPKVLENQGKFSNELETAKRILKQIHAGHENEFLNPLAPHHKNDLEQLTSAQKTFELYKYMQRNGIFDMFNSEQILMESESQCDWFRTQSKSASMALIPFVMEKGLSMEDAISQIRQEKIAYRNKDLGKGSLGQGARIAEFSSNGNEVEKDMADLTKTVDSIEWDNLSNQQKIEEAANLSFQFVEIHPFDNGNGRTSRALLDYYCVSSGINAPLLYKGVEGKQTHYQDALRNSSRENSSAFIDFIKSKYEKQFGIDELQANKDDEIEQRLISNLNIEGEMHI